MKIHELFENRKPTTFVAGRDFDLIPNTEFKGFVLGMEDDSDTDARKSTYAVYRPVGSYTFNNLGNDSTHNEYIRIHTVVDPLTGREHSPYTRGVNITNMYRYTVEQLISGKLKPEQVAVEPANGPVGDDLDPQGLPGQPMQDRIAPVMNEKFKGGIDRDYHDLNGKFNSRQNLDCVWIKKGSNNSWTFLRRQSSAGEAKAVAKRMAMATHIPTAVGTEQEPVLTSSGEPIGGAYGKGATAGVPTVIAGNNAQNAISFLKGKGYNTSGAVARKGQESGTWIVRHRNGETLVDLNSNEIQNLRESFLKKR